MFHAHREMIPVVPTSSHTHGLGAQGISTTPAKKRQLPSNPATADDLVFFQTAEGVTVEGNPVQFSRHSVVWELYNPGLAPRLSETLNPLKIIFQGRMIYAGRAVVNNLVDAGAKTVCDATLDEANWAGLDFSVSVADGQAVQAYKDFLGEWQKFYQVAPAFKLIIADLQKFLADLRLWLEQVELGLRDVSASNRPGLEQKVAGELGPIILPQLTQFFEKFEECLRAGTPALLPVHQAFARRQLHPLLLCSPFVYRCFAKPLGYAGDYEMVNMMLRDPLEGASLYAKIINLWFVRQPPAEAHRNRIRWLVRQLQGAATRAAAQNRTAKILSVGCGPAHEVRQFLQESHLADRTHFTLLDFSEETLAHCQAEAEAARAKFNRLTQFKFVKKSVQQIVREAARSGETGAGKYDLVYCAGLFDYLNDTLCQSLMDIFFGWLAPGGTLLTTNVDDSNPRRLTMEHIMAWHLVYRRGADMMALKPVAAPKDLCSVKADTTSVNLYFEAHKPE